MKAWSAGILVAVVLAAGANAAPTAEPSAGPGALVEAERAFARDVELLGIRDGFLRWLAPTAVVFAPEPKTAASFYAARPAGAARLAWQPETAALSAEGDLGWTSGPWQWRSDSTKREPQATGTFVTLWRRQADGAWKWVFDVGVSHAAAGADPPAVAQRTLASMPGKRGLWQRQGLWRADADFAKTASSQGLAAAIEAAAAPEVRWLREGATPVRGRQAARDSAAHHHPGGRMMSLAQFVSESGDLGYTYGSFVEGNAAAPDSSFYLHIWERAPSQPWALVLELFAPVPKQVR